MDNENGENKNFKSNLSKLSDDDEPALDVDINVLQQLASSRLNRQCVHARRLTRGFYNEIYLLQFDTGPDCIARLSRSLVHPTAKFASEVSTMQYVAQNTNIKVPEVYDWDCTVHNPIKTPYILMERLPGQHLYRIWDELTLEERKYVLSQIVDILLELWTKCQFKEIGCLYMDSNNCISCDTMTTFRLGPIVNSIFYTDGRDAIPSSAGPFRSLREFFSALIQKEKKFFEIHGVQEFVEGKMDQLKATNEVVELIKKLDLLQSKLSNIFDESIGEKPFALIHGDFDAQNILVERSPINDEIKIVGIIDWEFSHTGNLWNLCNYPIWIKETYEELFEVLKDVKLQEKCEKEKLRDFFRDEMAAKLGNKSRLILEMKERDLRISKLEDMFVLMVHDCSILNGLLEDFFYRYGSEVTNIHFSDPIIDYLWGPEIIKVQIPSKETIMCFLSKNDSIVGRSPFNYEVSVYCELKFNGYTFSWQQACTIAFHMWENEDKNDLTVLEGRKQREFHSDSRKLNV
ncbi:kinase-like domain-containing protein [Rhizophagus clarus]|uniref:Kinase-like domain-containing protein n=1 Tax=Rhizophagus clarus TaxID=94130 RepID=A0A8H3LSD2_9GLOM|nr:kinase-like domain-containing protein [Rhizophagus clarus]